MAVKKLSFIFLFLITVYCLLFTQKPSIPSPSPPLSPSFIPPLSLETIFKEDHSWTSQLPDNRTITLITTGDIIPARTVNYKMTIYNDFTHPFLKTADFLRSADITLINLESPLIKNCPVVNEGMVFCGSQRFIDGLLLADIDVVNLANNHTLNYGIDGIKQTINLLKNNNILISGYPLNNLTMKQCSNVTIGFLGWNFLEEFDEKKVLETIKDAKKQVDLLIVSAHWGAEYQPYPAEWQRKLAYIMIDAGADLIAGNHPHWTQPLEIYKDKIIIYAHGNFIFDQEWSLETKTGYIAKIVFLQRRIVDVQLFPVFISDYSQPEFLKKERKEEVLEKLKINSQNLAF